MTKLILDPCCGSRMFWFQRQHPNVIYGDKRTELHVLCDGRTLTICPDMEMDFRQLPFMNEEFKLVVFDPPHIKVAGRTSWLTKKYGLLSDNWQADIRQGFSECFRVLEPHGILIFKWNETQIKVNEILKLTHVAPLFGHSSGKRMNTHWICFMKL